MDLFRIPKIKQFTGGAVIRHNREVFKATGWAGCNRNKNIISYFQKILQIAIGFFTKIWPNLKASSK